MPKLLMFAPCEKVIVGVESGEVSLISILDTITLTIPSTVNMPSGANLPIRWYVFTLWQRLAEDEGRIYRERNRLCLPNGQVALEGVNEFRVSGPTQRNIFSILGFPAALIGPYLLKLSLQEASQRDEWNEIAEYPINVVRRG